MSDQAGSNVEWKKWGELDPLWGVSSWAGKERGSAGAWTDQEFYEMGRADWEGFSEQWFRYGIDPRRGLEIGCGAGRMTLQLSRTFAKMEAVDVSEGMLAYARKNVTAPHVTFHLTEGERLPLENGSITGVFSTHVFQHFDDLNHASRYFAEIARVMAPGGTLMIHLPVYQWPNMPRLYEFLYRFKKTMGHLQAAVLRPLIARGRCKPIMRGLRFPVDYLFTTLPGLGLKDVTVSIIPARSNGDPHPFVFARKA